MKRLFIILLAVLLLASSAYALEPEYFDGETYFPELDPNYIAPVQEPDPVTEPEPTEPPVTDPDPIGEPEPTPEPEPELTPEPTQEPIITPDLDLLEAYRLESIEEQGAMLPYDNTEVLNSLVNIQGYLIFFVVVILLYFSYKFFRIFF